MLSTLQPYLNPKQLLIEPFERLGFITKFVLVTLIASLGASFLSLHLPIYPVPIENWAIGSFGATWRTVDAAILGAVFGVIVGASQWLILRKFVPDWRWMIATTAGWCGFQISQTPLPSLINNYSENDIEPYYHQPLALFLVTFTPIGSLEVRSCRNYKLFWTVLFVLALVLIISTCLSLLMEQSRLRKLNIFQ